METRANYILIGAFTIAASLFLLLFALWAAKYSSDRDWNEYDVIFTEPVTGLSQGSSVQYNGIAVGTVDELKLAPNDPRQVIARLRLHASTPVRLDTRAKLSFTSVTGPPIIQLTGGSPESPELRAQDGRSVPIIRTETSALQNIADRASLLVDRLDQMLSERNIQRVTQVLENIEGVTGTFANQHEDLGALLSSARRASEQLESTLASTDSAITRLDREFVHQLPALIERLDGTLAKLDSVADGADAILNENRTAIGSFANDGLGQLGPTLGELRGLIRDLRRISDRLDANPARYLLGREAPKEFEP